MMFGRDDWTLFRNLSTLGQKAGVPRDMLAALALKELTDNALDAGAHVSIGPLADQGSFFVHDDGEGIVGADDYVAQLFSIRRPLTSSKLFRLPTRGALGNGLRVVAGTVLASGGWLRVCTRGRWLQLAPQDDGSTSHSRIDREPVDGMRVEIGFGGELRRERNPLYMAKLAIGMRGVSRYEGKTSPHWYDSDSFFELLHAAGDMPLKALLENVDGKLKRVTGTEIACDKIARDAADVVLEDLRSNCKPPKASKLGKVGEFSMSAHGYAKREATFKVDAARGRLGAVVPVVVEVWARKLGKDDDPSATIMVNRTPITARANVGKDGAQMYIVGCGLNHYFKTGKMPMNLVICVTAPYMQVTTDGKEPNLRPLLGDVAAAITTATRKAKKATSTGAPPVSKKGLIFDAMPDAVDKASGGGEHRFSLRQLFYAVRPILQKEGMDDELDYNYFSSVVTDYEKEQGEDVPGMYRDTRGVLYHPHTGEQIALGTLNVEKYKRPEYRFNKVLYIEKGGFFPLLIDAKWAERHDCALLTSQGFASRAARDVIDLMGNGDEELLFFCIHDADGPGTMIYQALVEGTRARPGRRVKVVNLGLEPWEGRTLGLQEESVKRAKGKVPVADYVKRERFEHGDHNDWYDWLQDHRYELNAMTSPAFLAWLDEKMREHDTLGKVVPPEEVLRARVLKDAEQEIRRRALEELAQKHKLELDAHVLTRVTILKHEVDGELAEKVRRDLKRRPQESWEQPLARIVARAAGGEE